MKVLHRKRLLCEPPSLRHEVIEMNNLPVAFRSHRRQVLVRREIELAVDEVRRFRAPDKAWVEWYRNLILRGDH